MAYDGPCMTRRSRLGAFLVKAFEDDTLRAFTEENLEDAAPHVAWTKGLAEQVAQLLRWIAANHQWAALWRALRAARPALTDQIARIEAEWSVPRNPIARPFTFLRDVPLVAKIAGGVALVGGVAALVVLLRPDRAHVVVMLDGLGRKAAGERIVVQVDGEEYRLPRFGLSIGEGPVLPESVAGLYRDVMKDEPGAMPKKVKRRVTTSSSIVVRYRTDDVGGRYTCKNQPSIDAGEQGYVVRWKDDCKPPQ